MSKYLNVFNTLAEYQAFSASTEYVQPNVALVKETNVLYYDYGNNKPQPNYTDYKVSSRSLVSDGGDTYGLNEKLCLNYIPSGVTSLERAFSYWSSLEEVTCEIPDGVTSMYSTFLGCKSLVTAPEIPSGVTDMRGTFQDCSRLVNVPEIPSRVTSLSSTFKGCTNLVNAPVIPSSVTDMYSTFDGCSSLVTAPEIPSGVKDMYGTFGGCTSLKEVTFLHKTPPTYRNTLIDCSKLETIYVPDKSVDAFKTATGWSQFASNIKPLSKKPIE